MSPEKRANLTDEECAAWDVCEAAGLPWAEMGDPFHGEIRRCSDFAPLFTDADDYPEARRFVGVASYALPLALEALAGARARIAALEAATPGEDPAPHVAGALDATKGGVLGVALTNCDSCRFDLPRSGYRYFDNRTENVIGWALEFCARDTGAPLPTATGCPGYSPRPTVADEDDGEIDGYFFEKFGLNPADPVDVIVVNILEDITDRRGWRQEWDGFDDDVKREIVASWCAIIRGEKR